MQRVFLLVIARASIQVTKTWGRGGEVRREREGGVEEERVH